MASIFDDEDEEEEEPVEVESEVVEEETSDSPTDIATPDDRNSVVRPVEDLDQVVEAYEKYEEVKDRLLSSEDLTKIGDSIHVNKSGWRKIATAFNVSVETTQVNKEVQDGIVRYTVTARAVAPNSKSTSGSGLCASNESNFMEAGTPDTDTRPQDHNEYLKIDGRWRRLKDPREVDEHSIMATAETRAKNRAISDLVGGGEVSAEEFARKNKEDVLE